MPLPARNDSDRLSNKQTETTGSNEQTSDALEANGLAGAFGTTGFLTTPETESREKTPLGLKVIGVLCIGGSVLSIPGTLALLLGMGIAFFQDLFAGESIITQVLFYIMVGVYALAVFAFLALGIRLLRNKRRGARQTAEVIAVLLAAYILCILMLFGVDRNLIVPLLLAVIVIVSFTYIDPSLSQERELQRRLRDMETREDAEEGTLGLDESGRGFIALDFFNLFWIFVIACLVGDIIEVIFHYVVVVPGEIQNRTGMLWGPFSPIYGFGAVLMTIALNRFHKTNVVIIFLVSAIIGGAFEYAVSWFMQFAFGAVAWDYTGTFLNIGGRTNFAFMCMWGALGVVWIKVFLPLMLKLVNLIPWQLRYSLTAVCAALMIFNGIMTLFSLDCWYSRLAGLEPDNALAWFFAEHFDNEWMANHFQSMSIDPSVSTRA